MPDVMISVVRDEKTRASVDENTNGCVDSSECRRPADIRDRGGQGNALQRIITVQSFFAARPPVVTRVPIHSCSSYHSQETI